MAEQSIVVAAKGVYKATMNSGLPTVGSSMSWGATVTEVQTITITGTPTGGTFKLTYQGPASAPASEETGTIAFDAAAAAVDTALEALTAIPATAIVCAGGPFPGAAVTVTYTSVDTTLASRPILPLKPTTIALTGGTNVAVAVTRTTMGCAGWTEVELPTDDGVELTFNYTSSPIRALGRLMKTHDILTGGGLSQIKFARYDSTEDAISLALPDADVSGTPMIGTGTRGYIALAIHCDNCVWLLPRVSSTGKLGLKYTNDKETQPGYEFDAYEDPYSPVKTTAWYRYPIV